MISNKKKWKGFVESIDLSRNCLLDTFHKSRRRKGKPFFSRFSLVPKATLENRNGKTFMKWIDERYS